MSNPKEIIAKRIAQELKDGNVVNLGIGVPELVSNFVPKDVHIILQSENGILGMGKIVEPGHENKDYINAGYNYVEIEKEACFFDSAFSFALIRGGHVDLTVLGALEVDEKGSLASHIIPGKMVPGMGGAMDLVNGAKNVIVATTHTKKNGGFSIVKRISLPATAISKVNMIVTEYAVLEVSPFGLVLKEMAEGITVEEIQKITEPKLIVSKELKKMQV